MTDPIRKTLTVPMRPEQAFDLFTDKLADWWPVETHSLSAANGDLPRDVTVEGREGGRITETRPDGDTAPWGTVTRWEPGRAFGVAWHVGRDASEATDLLVVFTPVETGTRVDLTHDGFDRLDDAATAMAGSYRSGWDLVLVQRFGRYCAAHQPA